jgi:hypothetical protein
MYDEPAMRKLQGRAHEHERSEIGGAIPCVIWSAAAMPPF